MAGTSSVDLVLSIPQREAVPSIAIFSENIPGIPPPLFDAFKANYRHVKSFLQRRNNH
jgi:hypothetical protein